MNRKQQSILIIMSMLIGIMVLFPPYVVQCGKYNFTSHSGYAFIFSLPREDFCRTIINVTALATPICGILIVGGLLYIALKNK